MTDSLTLELHAKRQAGEPAAAQAGAAEPPVTVVEPTGQTRFSLHSGDCVFTTGGALAREMDDALAALGCHAPMLDLHFPTREWFGRAAGALSRLTPPAIRQALERTAAIHARGDLVRWEEDCAPLAFDCGDGTWYDLDLAPFGAPVGRDRFLERRQHLHDVCKSALTADGIVMAPSHVETWRDLETGLCIHGAPTNRRLLGAVDRFRFELQSLDQAGQDLSAAIDVVRAHNPAVKVILAVSPTPHAVVGQDAASADAYSKSVLYAACERLAADLQGVDHAAGEAAPRMAKLYVKVSDVRAAAGQDAATAFQAQNYNRAIVTARSAPAEPQPDVTAVTAPAEAQQDVAAVTALAESLIAEGKWELAEQALRPALEADPDQSNLAFLLGRAVLWQGKHRRREAVELARKIAAASKPKIKEMIWAVHILANYVRLPREAETLARRMIQASPKNPKAYQALIDLLIAGQRDDDAIDLLNTAVALPGAMARNSLQLAQLLQKNGDIEQARDQALLAAERNPAEPGLQDLLDEIDALSPAAVIEA